jgi:hypothetical protein
MESILNNVNFAQYRLKSFKGTAFEKSKTKCNAKNVISHLVLAVLFSSYSCLVLS